MLDAVYVDMTQGLVQGHKPKPEFLPLFNLGEPVTTGDAELVTGGVEQSRTIPRTQTSGVGGGLTKVADLDVSPIILMTLGKFDAYKRGPWFSDR